MDPDMVAWLFKIIAIGIVGFSVASIFFKISATPAAPPVPAPEERGPFASRQEYLAAAAEMDLELFLERARLTPPSVIERRVALEAKDFVWTEAKKPSGDSGPVGPVGAPGEIGPRGVGAWYRVKRSGKLVCLLQSQMKYGFGLYATGPSESVAYHESDLEIAIPRMGESWWKSLCNNPHNYSGDESLGWTYWSIVYRVNASPVSPAAEAARCGCLVPVNFGKAEGEKKSGVA
jgi:hypothetical protein